MQRHLATLNPENPDVPLIAQQPAFADRIHIMRTPLERIDAEISRTGSPRFRR